MSVTTPTRTTSYTYATPVQVIAFGSGPNGTPGNSLASIVFPDSTHQYFTYGTQDPLFTTSQDGLAKQVTYTTTSRARSRQPMP